MPVKNNETESSMETRFFRKKKKTFLGLRGYFFQSMLVVCGNIEVVEGDWYCQICWANGL
jgi:hypothetical protein